MRKLIRLKRRMRGDVVLLALAVTFLMALPVSGLGQDKGAPAGRGGTAGPSTTVGAVAPTSAQDDKRNGGTPGDETAMNGATTKFDVVSFKRCETSAGHPKNTILPVGGDSFGWECQSISRMLLFAFATDRPRRLSGQPAWVDDDAYSFQAKVAPEDVAAWGKLDLEVKRAMVRDVLVDALRMKVHVDATPRPVYDLVVAKGGAKLTAYKPGSEKDLGGGRKLAGGGMASVSPGVVFYQATTMAQLAYALTFRMDRPVIDKTGLSGRFDVQLTMGDQHYDAKTAKAEDTGISEIMDGLKQLGLRLESAKAPLNGLVVDHVERPEED
jgi:uncharacterized protein (TIGR03435 family)